MNNNGIHVIELNDDNALPELAKLLGGIFGKEAKKKAAREAMSNELAYMIRDHICQLCAIADKYGVERRKVLFNAEETIMKFLIEADVDTLNLETGDFKTWEERLEEHERKADQ